MAKKSGPCQLLCSCLACIFVLVVIFVVIGFLLGLGGVLLVLKNYAPCYAIAYQEPHLMRIEKNVTVPVGSPFQVDCKIINYGLVHGVYWSSSKYEAGIGGGSAFSVNPTTYKHQHGVDVTVGWSKENFYCQAEPKINGTVTVSVKTFTLLFDPVNVGHEGWYTCMTNFTLPTTASGKLLAKQPYYMEKKFYLSVVA